jgi:hypothetical protein
MYTMPNYVKYPNSFPTDLVMIPQHASIRHVGCPLSYLSFYIGHSTGEGKYEYTVYNKCPKPIDLYIAQHNSKKSKHRPDIRPGYFHTDAKCGSRSDSA